MEFRFFFYKTPLNIAIERENIDIVDLLLMNDKIDTNKGRKFSRQKEDMIFEEYINPRYFLGIYLSSNISDTEYEKYIPYIIFYEIKISNIYYLI